MPRIVRRHDGTEYRRPYDPSAYHVDLKDEHWEEEREELRHLLFLTLKWRKSDAVSQLEAYLRALSNTSTEKPRWQKIIEHANSLADELEMSREQFYSRALIEFIEKLENSRLTDELNEAYKNIDQEEDLAFLNRLVSDYDPRVADE